jgi:hypothetical protein
MQLDVFNQRRLQHALADGHLHQAPYSRCGWASWGCSRSRRPHDVDRRRVVRRPADADSDVAARRRRRRIRSANKRTMRTFRRTTSSATRRSTPTRCRTSARSAPRPSCSRSRRSSIERLAELRPMHEVTLEYHRANALQGILLDADGSTLLNLFTEFGVTQQTQDIAFTTTTTDVRGKIIAAKRLAEDELGGEVITGWRGFCSSGWFDASSHATVTRPTSTRKADPAAADLRTDRLQVRDVDFEEYRGSVTKPDSVGGGTAAFIPANTAWLVPVTAPVDLHHPLRAGRLRGDRQHARPAALREAGAGSERAEQVPPDQHAEQSDLPVPAAARGHQADEEPINRKAGQRCRCGESSTRRMSASIPPRRSRASRVVSRGSSIASRTSRLIRMSISRSSRSVACGTASVTAGKMGSAA